MLTGKGFYCLQYSRSVLQAGLGGPEDSVIHSQQPQPSLGWQGQELLPGTGAWQPPEGALLELYWVPGHIAVPCDGCTFQETRMPHILFLSLRTAWMSHVSQEPADLPAAGLWTAPAAASEHRSQGGWLAKAG